MNNVLFVRSPVSFFSAKAVLLTLVLIPVL